MLTFLFCVKSKTSIFEGRLTDPDTFVKKNQTEDNYLLQLDGLRFVAVCLVLIDHWLAERNTIPFGPLGVDMFFVLSGFLISRILITSKLKDDREGRSHWFSFRQFYIRRSLRIFPVYYLSVFLLIIFRSPSVIGKEFWHLFYATNLYIALQGTWLGLTDHFWSLAVEEQFYLFFPLLIFSVPVRYFKNLFVGLVVLSVCLRGICLVTNQMWMVQYVSMPTCLDSFGLGAILAYLFVFQVDKAKQLLNKTQYVLISLFAYILVLIYAKSFDNIRNISTEVLERLVASIFCFFLIGKAIVGWSGVVKWLLANRVSNYLGRISYGLYVYHNFVYNYYHTLPHHPTMRLLRRVYHFIPTLEGSLLFQLIVFFCISITLATLSWYCIEKPINGLKRYFSY